MTRITKLTATFLVIVSVTGVAQANLLDDPSFEAATSGTQTSNSNWVLTANLPDGLGASAQFQSNVWSSSDGDTGVWFKSFEGNQDPGDPPANAQLSQTVSNVAQSGDYFLTFQSARETNFTAAGATASLSSSAGPFVALDLLTATYNDDGNLNSDPTTFSLLLPGVMTGDDLTVSVDMIDGVASPSNPQSFFVDNFSLTLVPEPASIVLCGFGLLSVLAQRRKRQQADRKT